MTNRLSRHLLWAVPTALAFIVLFQRPLVAQDKPAEPDAAFRPAAPRLELMEWHDRTYNALRLAIAKKKPEAVHQAWLLAELANVNSQHSDKTDYSNWASQLRDTAAQVAKVAEEKNFDRAKELAKQMNNICTSCHDKYQ